MLTSSFIFRPILTPRHVVILIAVGAIALGAATIGRAYLEIQATASDRLVELHASYKAIPDLATLKSQADLVVVGRIAQNGTTNLVTQPGNAGAPAAAPAPFQLSDKKANAVKQLPAPQSSTDPSVPNANIGTPVTTYEVQIQRVLKGSVTGQINVTQLGGKVSLDTFPGGPKLQRTVVFEGDTLLNAGERHVLFLKRANDGTFFVVGGPQGRLSIDNTDKLQPIDSTAPAHRGRAGGTLEAFIAELGALP
jgi:hypothetical protein